MTTDYSRQKTDLNFEITIISHQLLHITNQLMDASRYSLSHIIDQKENYRELSKELVTLATKLDALIDEEFKWP